MFRTLDRFMVPGIVHGFFGRTGGVSTGVYASLNVSLTSDDDPAAIMENRARIAGTMNVTPDRLLTAYQVHSPDCVFVDAPFALEDRPRADALVTAMPGLAIGVSTADCGPVLFHGRTRAGGPIIAAAHAGWGGALKGVLEATVTTMCDHGAELASIMAAVGPCISKKSYEVSIGFEDPFLTRDPADEVFFHSTTKPDKMIFDLPGYIARRLASCGIKNVVLSDIDTLSNPDEYFSYRRACLAGAGGAYGLQMSAIVIQS